VLSGSIGGTKRGAGRQCLIRRLSRRAGFFPSIALISILSVIIARSAIIFTVSSIIIAVVPVVEFSRVIATHPRLKVPDSFAKALGDLRYAARTEQDDYYHRYHQQLGHSKWTHSETP
jgi:hypothetical protein